jgi:hypothetical protein
MINYAGVLCCSRFWNIFSSGILSCVITGSKIHFPETYYKKLIYVIEAFWGTGEAYTGFWCGNLMGKRPLGRLRRRWVVIVEMDLQEVRCGGMDWIDLA